MRSETRTSRATAPPAYMTLAGRRRRRPVVGVSSRVVNPQKDRAEQKRQEKLAEIREQVKKGELSIRQMTPAERKANPPKQREPKRGRR